MTSFFYESLTPTGNAPVIYSNIFSLDYADPKDMGNQQAAFDTGFRNAVHNPANYNSQWSAAYSTQTEADQDRTSEITALTAAGKIVSTPNYPI
jgi:hypothetical protein